MLCTLCFTMSMMGSNGISVDWAWSLGLALVIYNGVLFIYTLKQLDGQMYDTATNYSDESNCIVLYSILLSSPLLCSNLLCTLLSNLYTLVTPAADHHPDLGLR